MNIPPEIDYEAMPEELANFIATSQLKESDATEWLIFHSYLVDHKTGRCAISPPMLALNFDVAQTVYNSLLENGLESMRQQYDQAYFARMVDNSDEMRVGIFAELNEKQYPLEVMIIMDRRKMTYEMYDQLYIHSTTGKTTVSEFAIREKEPSTFPPEKPILH